MERQKKRKIKKWLKEHKGIIIGVGSFLLIGLIGMLVGFEIQQNGHAIRNWLSSPYASTFFICLLLGAAIFGILVATFINMNRGDE